MSDRFNDEPPRSGRLGLIIIVLILTMVLWVIMNFGFFDEPKEEVEGIIVRFILFFKLNTLI